MFATFDFAAEQPYDPRVRWGCVPLAACAACLAGVVLQEGARAQPDVCIAPAITSVEYEGAQYRIVALSVPDAAPLGVASAWIQDKPCNDTVVPGAAPPPPLPLPPPRRVDVPVSRLAGISPRTALGAPGRPGWIWVSEGCAADEPIGIAVGCLELEPLAAHQAVETSATAAAMTSSNGTFPLIFGSSQTCTLPQLPPPGSQPTPVTTVCRIGDGSSRRHRSASARFGEVVRFNFRTYVTSARISYGRRRPVELTDGSGDGWTATWRIPASGTYYARLFVRSETPVSRTEITYWILLRVRGTADRREG